MDKREKFFYDNAGYSYNPRTETAEDGRVRCARELAKAELNALEVGLRFAWGPDHEEPSLYWCGCYSEDGRLLVSIHAIDLGDNDPWTDPYARVIEAELALTVRF